VTVLHQDIGDGWSAVADVFDAGCGSVSLGEDLTLQIGDDDLVAITDDENPSKGMLGTNPVGN
jgi:hypothetical protein